MKLHPELRKVATEMVLASKDFDENIGSADVDIFWKRFENKRECYRIKKKQLEDEGKL